MLKCTIIKTNNNDLVTPYVKALYKPKLKSHKGQNGKLLIVGGSSLFHSASLWSAEISSKIVDMVHYSSTKENSQIFINLKTKWTNGIVIKQNNLLSYAKEDDTILIGPGMIRGTSKEATYTKEITEYLLSKLPNKQFVLDAGSIQMVSINLFKNMNKKIIITPHKDEFKHMFKTDLTKLDINETCKLVHSIAINHNCIIHLKMVYDIITDGKEIYIIEGGNPGLTKGGSGDVLAGLISSLATKNNPLLSCIVASVLIKKSAELLYKKCNYWFSMTELINQIPKTLKLLLD